MTTTTVAVSQATYVFGISFATMLRAVLFLIIIAAIVWRSTTALRANKSGATKTPGGKDVT